MIDGKQLCEAIISAANNIANHRKQVDALNVFPVPDGDTGTNMSMTMGAAKRELELYESAAVGDIAHHAASALLRGARGNSGVILSLLFRGFSKGLQGKKNATSADFVAALQMGVEAAYKAVMKPTEGTILTVARCSAQEAKLLLEKSPQIDIPELWAAVIESASKTLAETPEMLPVLKKAGVVDAGGKGLLLIYEGMGHSFAGKGVLSASALVKADNADTYEMPDERNAAGEYEGEITFTYCTEFIVIKDEARANALSLRAYLESIGDSVVVVEDEEIIKCHVHTDNPGNALQRALESGQLTNLKIDNMREQHASQKRSAASKKAVKRFEYASVNTEREYGFVAVAAGEGIQALFRDLNVDNVVSGGQTMNPSTDDILEAIHATPAKTVIVLPNNKNIIMAAEQAVRMADRKVYVLPTTSVPQGLSALLSFDTELSLKENQLIMVKAAERVGTGQITFAARDSVFDGHKIKKDEILALENGKVAFSEKEVSRAAVRLVRSLLKRSSTFVTLIYGEDVNDEQAAETEALVRAKLPDSVELALIKGEQPVYYYIISVE